LQKDGPPLHFQGVSAYLATVFPGNRVWKDVWHLIHRPHLLHI
jgi:hypothetical protein